MTTIASDGRTVSADGQETWGSEIVSLTREKIKLVDGRVFAVTGVAALVDPCIAWAISGADPKDAPEVKGDSNSWQLLEFLASTVVLWSNTVPYASPHNYPFSVGSGCDYAMGAMMAGASSEDAIRIASQKCIHTGGRIAVVPVPQLAAIREAAE